MPFVATESGVEAISRADISGDSILIGGTLRFGQGQYDPAVNARGVATQRSLITPFAPEKNFILPGMSYADGHLATIIQDTTDNEYAIGERGIFDKNGVLLFIESTSNGPLQTKGSSTLVVAVRIAYTGTTASLTFGDVDVTFPRGDEDTYGAVRFGTAAEVAAKTPGNIALRVSDASEGRGLGVLTARQIVMQNNLITLSPDPTFTELNAGDYFSFFMPSTASGSVTMRVNSVNRVFPVRFRNKQAGSGDLLSGDEVTVMFDGANFQLIAMNMSDIVRYAVGDSEAQIPLLQRGGVFSAARIPGLPASRITSGQFSVSRIPGLPASRITSGELALARIPESVKNQGANIVAAQITSGSPSRSESDAGLSVTITPSSTSKRVLLELSVPFATYTNFHIYRGSVMLFSSHPVSVRSSESVLASGIDSPASTSAQTYKVRWIEGDSNTGRTATTQYPIVLKATEID